MYGGVSKSYCKWNLVGEPYKKDDKYYVLVENPLMKGICRPKEVRFYTDKAHAALMPTGGSNGKKYKPFPQLFGFDDCNDWVWCIREKDLTEEEKDLFRNNEWKLGAFYGISRYAPKTVCLPSIKQMNKYFKSNWADFKSEGQRNSKLVGLVPESESWWFKDDEAYFR